MVFWVLICLAATVGVKYYTSIGLRQLDRRLALVKRDLEQSKSVLKDKMSDQDKASEEENLNEERIRSLKDLITDLEYRLTVSSEEQEEKSV